MERSKDIQGLINALGYEKDYDVQRNAVKALHRIGTPAVDPLIAALQNPDKNIWGCAGIALASREEKKLSNL